MNGNGLVDAVTFLIHALGGLYLLAVLLRFVLQLVRADFYNPLSQFIVRATSPLLMPLRRVIPGFGGIDLASLVLAVLVQLALMLVILALNGTPWSLLHLLAWALIGVASLFLKIFFFSLIVSAILSWVAPRTYNPTAQLVQQICEPVLAPIRRFMPNLGVVDISPIFALIALHLLDRYVVLNLAEMTLMPSAIAFFL
ncbi:hypothetical protein SF06_19910 [Pseudomonas flexibilis]|uniref:YggT family protein n=1 Tax=Pseudomonas flexibilis TaxID=706570 RepID=A0A1N6Q6V7_9PSED|nr:YggT family protein [Pseudomonas flexibilis]KHL69259.1 hypothetical protein SF06_19910 [Pseudomonas flexibilis]SIQ12300.1 YggT family protein [Pseudomonas flexibilis]